MSEGTFTFSADGNSDEFSHTGRYSQITIGKVGSDDFGGGVVSINKTTLDGGTHVIRNISADQFAAMTNKTLRLELTNATKVFVSIAGSTTPDLYVEHRNQLG